QAPPPGLREGQEARPWGRRSTQSAHPQTPSPAPDPSYSRSLLAAARQKRRPFHQIPGAPRAPAGTHRHPLETSGRAAIALAPAPILMDAGAATTGDGGVTEGGSRARGVGRS